MEVEVLVEIPMGSRNKYEMDEKRGVIVLDRVLHTNFVFPVEYGHIPHTLADDGDPLDAMILIRYPTFPGCRIKARIIGAMVMSDENGKDDKLLCVPVDDPYFKEWRNIGDVPKQKLEEIRHFFEHYKDLEPGKFVKFERWVDKAEAEEIYQRALRHD